ncbi:NUDIX hydrolase [candidate division TA06 bacterium]|uniref:NUDIX hydrolase n=1 Tax=candidate division TA06 bacterium TaxID=2250710 RepID=A0A933IE95_UNCT6|nr:NUDIX hydrolase [candidate division TA06 bacterium]
MIYKHCPSCGSHLNPALLDGHRRQTCPDCGFVYYRNPAPAAGCIILLQGKLLLVRRKYQPHQGDWCLPSGFMEYGESPKACARREIFEETGLRIRTGELIGVYSGTDDPRTQAVLIVYLGIAQNGDYRPGDDASAIKLFPRDRLPENIAFKAHAQAIRDFCRYAGIKA